MLAAPGFLLSLHLSAVVGALAVAVNNSWPVLRNRKRILLVQVTGSSLFGLHYTLIGSSTAAAMCAAGIAQGAAAVLIARRGPRLAVFAATILAGLTATALTWHGATSVLAQMGGLLSASGRLQRDVQRLRWLFLCSEACWTAHNLLAGSPWGLTSDAVAVTMLVTGLWRGRRAGARAPELAPA